ncbi:hypothetical protein IAU59_000122 [Kwoniella sp. CBS 9459]
MGWFFGSSSSSSATGSNDASSSSSASTFTSTSTSIPMATLNTTDDERSQNDHVPTVNTFEGVLSDEERYQALQYPSTEEVPGCMRLLDEFLMCYALAPQLRSMYRHGEFRDCTWKWQDFKYCMSLKSEDEEARRQLWIKRRADWWARRRVGGSSEDVWEVRREPLENFPPVGEEVTSETSTT